MPDRAGNPPSANSSNNHRLPSIPSLPPLVIPRSNFNPSSLNAPQDKCSLSLSPENDSALPTSAELSVESFATACSSPVVCASAIDASRAESQSVSQAPVRSTMTRGLSKSLSVDSFVREQQGRDATDSAPAEPSRTVGPSKSHSRLQFSDPKMEQQQYSESSEPKSSDYLPPVPPRNISAPALRTLAQRVKRQSRQAGRANKSEDEFESSPYEDSEFEQARSGGGKVMTKALRVRRRLTTPKRSGSMSVSRASSQQGSQTRKAVGGVLATNLTNINTVYAGQTPPASERSPQLRSKASAPTPLEATRRGRSFSIDTQSDDTATTRKVKPSMSLHVDTGRPPSDAILMTLVVIGSRGCGKSAFIRRAWKHSLIMDASRHSVQVKDDDGGRTIHYITRKAYMQAHEDRDYYLTLIEISIEELEYADGEIHGNAWPSILPEIDGAFVLYDASERSSFRHTEELIRSFYARGIPYIVLACKSDLCDPDFPRCKQPKDALDVVKKYDGGIVEISSNDMGRDKAKRSVGVLLRGVLRRRYGDVKPDVNPCSPVLYNAPIKPEVNSPSLTTDDANSASVPNANTPTSAITPSMIHSTTDPPRQPPPQIPLPPPPVYRSLSSLAAQAASPITPPANMSPIPPNEPDQPEARLPSAPTSPTRARSMGDMNMVSTQNKSTLVSRHSNGTERELNRSKSIIDLARRPDQSAESVKSAHEEHEERQQTDAEPINPFRKDLKKDHVSPWATVEELLEKLLFLSISGDEPSFISHFFLTYRRFTTPRRILLAMQKRMLELNKPSADVTLAAFAQLRICNLLEHWIQSYPLDFAVPGSAGALNALIRQILRQPHTLYYGTDFLPFLESLHTLQDLDSSWAIKADTIEESDESDSNYESDFAYGAPTPISESIGNEGNEKAEPAARPSTRERKSSIPLSAKSFLHGTLQGSLAGGTKGSFATSPTRDSLQRLQKASSSLLHFDPEDVAKEITRRELELYMKIEPRDWLRHTLVPGKKDPNVDRVARFNTAFNDLHDWAASMILCHDRAKMRARVVEKLAEVAVRLRNMNNYSGLRAIITAITQSTYPNDEVMEIFKTKVDLHKKYLSSDILMRTAGAHQSYRLALRNTKGPCIPCLEVHTSDLRRAHEGNPDHKSDDPSKIHWAKFNMIGKFVGTTTELQNQCRGPNGYNFSENSQIGQLFDVPIMDYDLQQERLGPPPNDGSDIYSVPIPPTLAPDHPGRSRDPGVVRRLFFWSQQ